MNQSLFELLFKTQAVCLILMKVLLLAKYFVFMRYKSSDWKPIHLVYFPAKNIMYSDSMQAAKAKLMQNHFSIHFGLLMLVVIVARNWMG